MARRSRRVNTKKRLGRRNGTKTAKRRTKKTTTRRRSRKASRKNGNMPKLAQALRDAIRKAGGAPI